MVSIEELIGRLKDEAGGWEKAIFHWACDLAKALAKQLLEKMDVALMKAREAGLKIEGFRERWITTLFGDIRVKRRLYRDSRGRSRFLLDESLGLRKRSQASPRVEELATFLSSHLPFGKCQRILQAVLPQGISHTTIHRLVGRAVDPHVKEEERELSDLFEDGVLPQSQGRQVPYLMVEADGTSIALQREKGRRTEVKIGIAYEGWRPLGKDRYELKEKTSYTGIMDGERFWEGFSLALSKKYDMSGIGRVVVGSDGAPWARDGAEVLGGLFQLDRFHLLRAIYRGVGSDLSGEVYRACVTGDVNRADAILRQAQQDADEESAGRIAQLRGYLLANAKGLRDYRLVTGYDGMRGMGAIEANVDKLIATRMKKQGMSWTVRGANRMARLINLRELGRLHLWVNHRGKQPEAERPPTLPARPPRKAFAREGGDWLEAVLPATAGPHADRPWAQALRSIARQKQRRL